MVAHRIEQTRRRLAVLRSCVAGPGDGWRALRVLAWALLLPVLKRVLPLRTLVRLMWSTPRHRWHPEREAALVTLVGWLYRPRRLTNGNCLERSLVLYHFLAEGGARPRLVIGLRPAGGTRGHAWVLCNGRPVGETWADVQEFTPLVTFGDGGVIRSGG
ncbi:MAG TPA: lasso peptide biosynthesis B2 protein [Chloroflexia bacterium]|nr:lasso peptide biosynthesis B2 protein [Chloroflexia bacterium]